MEYLAKAEVNVEPVKEFSQVELEHSAHMTVLPVPYTFRQKNELVAASEMTAVNFLPKRTPFRSSGVPRD